MIADKEEEKRSISEKVLEASLSERYMVSRMRDPMEPDRENHPHKCNILQKGGHLSIQNAHIREPGHRSKHKP